MIFIKYIIIILIKLLTLVSELLIHDFIFFRIKIWLDMQIVFLTVRLFKQIYVICLKYMINEDLKEESFEKSSKSFERIDGKVLLIFNIF